MTTRALVPRRGFSRRRFGPNGTPIPGNVTCWVSHDGIVVMSELGDMQLPGTEGTQVGPTWFLSVSHNGARPSDDDMARVIDAFDMPAFDEDNHYPGITRGVFCPVDETARAACDCKITETVITEPDGFEWTNPTDGPCRGCELDALRRIVGVAPSPCPIHGAVS